MDTTDNCNNTNNKSDYCKHNNCNHNNCNHNNCNHNNCNNINYTTNNNNNSKKSRVELLSDTSSDSSGSGSDSNPNPNQKSCVDNLESTEDKSHKSPTIKKTDPNPQEIGQGAFGIVTKVVLDGVECAVKTIKGDGNGIDVSAVRECTFGRGCGGSNYVWGAHHITLNGSDVKIYSPLAKSDMFNYIFVTPDIPTRYNMMKQMAFSISVALNHLHQNGIIHRDVKPSNMLLYKDTVYLADLGASREHNARKPHRLSLIGSSSKKSTSTSATSTSQGPFQTTDRVTVVYRPPESATSDYDYKVDIYSLGCCLIHLLTGIFIPATGQSGEIPPTPQQWIAHLKKYISKHSKHLKDIEHWSKLIIWMLNESPLQRPNAYQLLQTDLIKSIGDQLSNKQNHQNIIPQDALTNVPMDAKYASSNFKVVVDENVPEMKRLHRGLGFHDDMFNRAFKKFLKVKELFTLSVDDIKYVSCVCYLLVCKLETESFPPFSDVSNYLLLDKLTLIEWEQTIFKKLF